ncbi:ATP-binding cassette domain-containing protein [Deferrisoma sp.]
MSGIRVAVEGVSKTFSLGGRWGRRRRIEALGEVSFALEPGEFAALVGESGSGKTTLGRCLLGLLRPDAGRIRVGEFDPQRVRGRERKAFARAAQMVFQNPYATLNPAFRVRYLLEEAVRIHRDIRGGEVAGEVERLAETVRLPAERLHAYPPELSGGERRRVAFARALATRPGFVVADEPVAGLDPPIQVGLVELLRRVHERRRLTVLLVTHDLRVVRTLVSRVLVLFRGRLVEDAPAEGFFGGKALHPYSRELLESAFGVAGALARPPRPFREPAARGCPFLGRCGQADPSQGCDAEVPPLVPAGPAHRVACHLAGRGDDGPVPSGEGLSRRLRV